jgi:hypothetical protein
VLWGEGVGMAAGWGVGSGWGVVSGWRVGGWNRRICARAWCDR